MKKGLSLLLALLMVVSVFSPALPSFGGIKAEAAGDALATVFTGSDFQDNSHGNQVVANFKQFVTNAQAAGYEEPDAFLFGGDFTSASYGYADSTLTVPRMTEAVHDIYPYYNTKNIVNVQGNHDIFTDDFNATGLHEFDEFLVYVINLKDYPASRGDNALAITEATTNELIATFDKLMAEGETRPIFIATHLPMHYNSRNPSATNADGTIGYNENHYGKILFDAINAYAVVFDVIFLFGHNHSGPYDDYIGGSVNFLAPGETIKLHDNKPGEGNYVERTLNFTYMNYGYMGYSNNGVDKTLTMSAFEICADKINVTRFSVDGKYGATKTVERKLKTNVPSVTANGYNGGTVGSATGAIAIPSGFTDPVYTWTSNNNSVAKISANGRVAQIAYNAVGTATVTVTVRERNDSSKVATDSYEVTVTNDPRGEACTVRVATQIVNDKTLEYYETSLGKTVALIGSYEGLGSSATATWSSSNTSVATVDQYGVVTFNGTGSTFITYTVTYNGTTYSAKVKFVISTEKKTEYIYQEVAKSFSAGKKYVIATTRSGNHIHKDELGSYNQGQRLNGTATSFSGSSPNRTVSITDDSYVWNAIATDTAGVYYLQNESSGKYLVGVDSAYDATARGDFAFTTEVPSVAEGGWYFDANGNLQNAMFHWYIRGAEVNLINAANTSYTVLFERKSASASATIEFSGEKANGATKTVYSATNGKQIPLHGDYVNIQQCESETWTSSNTNVATIDNNGVVTFKGVQGDTTITYTVKDAVNGNTVSATLTLSAILTTEVTRTFRYVTQLEAGKKYVAATKTGEVADAYLLSSFRDTNSSLLAERSKIQATSNGEYFVEIEVDKNYPVWIAEDDGAGHYYLKSEKEGRYLYANGSYSSGTVSTSESVSSEKVSDYQWTYTNKDIYNQTDNTDGTGNKVYLCARSAEFIGINTPSTAEFYFYEETVLLPNGVITSRYDVVGETLVRNEICPYQTETLVPKAENFPDNSRVTFAWASNNNEVATIDQNGVITYTGKAGVVTVTLTTTSLEYDATGIKPVDTTTVKITVVGDEVEVGSAFYLTDELIPGRLYLYSDKNVSGSAYIMNNTQCCSDSLAGIEATVIVDSTGTYINCTDEENIWECVDSGRSDGFHYLRNVKSGKYLTLGNVADYSEGSTTQLFKYKTPDNGTNWQLGSLSGRYNRAQTHSSSTGVTHFRNSSGYATAYIYEARISSNTRLETQIRKQDYFGSVDITNVMQYRYEIGNGDKEQMLQYIAGLQDGYISTWSVSDTSIATINGDGMLTYKGKDGYVDVILTIAGKDYNGNSVNKTLKTTFDVSTQPYQISTEDYPDYPTEGAVRTNKVAHNVIGSQNFQYTGVSQVELAVTGVPLEQPIDVVVVLDHSDSMGPEKMQSAIKNTRDFALQLFNANDKNRIAVVTFDQYRYYYDNITSQNITDSSKGTEDKIITGDGTIYNPFATADDKDALVENLNSLENNNTGGTNYDSGLNYAYRILSEAKTNGGNESQVVIFMSDGAPTKFNGLKLSGTSDAGSLDEAWLRGDESNAELAAYLADTSAYPAAANFNPDGDNWYAVAIKSAKGEAIDGIPNTFFYESCTEGLGAKIFTIGYGVKSNSNEEKTLKNIASTPANFYSATSDLSDAYDSILENILYAANDAVVTDKLGSKFDLQFATAYNVGGDSISLDPAPAIEVGAWTLNNAGERVKYTSYEKISFTTDARGDLTAASSSVLGSGVYDTASSRIVGQYVTYDLNTETFTWNIGDITRDEVVLTYYAALEGFKEGTAVPNVYETNDFATLDYTNFRGTACQQTFNVPAVAYKQAAIGYEFYLVNVNGEPVNRQGVVVPFSERVLVGNEQTMPVYMSSEDFSYTLEAANAVPSGYTLYNTDSAFTIVGESGSVISAEIYDDGTPVTTWYRIGTTGYRGEVPDADSYFTTHVSFGVIYKTGIVPDSVVIDFGLPVKVNVLVNDLNVEQGTLTAIGTGVQSGTVLHTNGYTSRMLTGEAATLQLKSGTATIVDDKVVYTPKSTNYSAVETIYYEYKTVNNEYYYTTVTVIPATSIYFEETMFTFENSTVEKKGVTYNYNWVDVGTPVGERFQSEDRPGTFTFADADANNVYGTDSAYADSTTYSMGSAKYVQVDINSVGKAPKAKFTFTGTGIDLFSVTDNTAGLLTISLYQGGKKVTGYMVSTYHGYSYDSTLNDGAGGYAPAESGAIFQVPVFRIRDLSYGTYDVVVEPMYSGAFDVTKAGKYGVYVDSVRIFEPMGGDNEVANDAYLADGEFGTEYLELRDTIVKKNADGEFVVNTYDNSSLYFDGINPNAIDKITDYVKNGPKNEVYLGKGQAIAFNISASSDLNLASLQIGMKLIGNNGNAKVTVMNANQLQPNAITLTSATEQFFKLDSVVVWNQAKINAPGETSVYETVAPIIIRNTSDTDVVISLTSLKWGFTDDIATGTSSFRIFANENTAPLAYAAMARMDENNAQPQEPEFNPVAKENITVSAPAEVEVTDGKGTLTVTTQPEVIKVTVDGAILKDCEIDEDGNKRWTYEFDATEPGEKVFTIVAEDFEGNVSEEIVAETVIKPAPEVDDPDDGVVDDGEDNTTGDVGSGNLTPDSFVNNLLNGIFSILMKLFSLFLGGATI